MCELLGFSSRRGKPSRKVLEEFFSHSVKHHDGWGLAFADGGPVTVVKEPVRAIDSVCLREWLDRGIPARNLLAHIRLATVGFIEYGNCHPFVLADAAGRDYTLIHNGTMFNAPALNPYLYVQRGRTDSERVLHFLIDRLNAAIAREGRPLVPAERFATIDAAVRELAPRNKLNLLIFDGELMYAHTNYARSLHTRAEDDAVWFSTTPLGDASWEPLPMNTLVAFRDGEQVFSGTGHGGEYIDNTEDMKHLFLDAAAL